MEAAQQYDLLRLQTQAFEAVNEMVRSASDDTLPLVGHLIPFVLEKIASTLDPGASAAIDKPGDLQARPPQFFEFKFRILNLSSG